MAPVSVLVAGMVITGAANSLFTKFQDMQCVEDCDHAPVVFEQPVWQTLQMFLGETLCFLPVIFSALRARGRPPAPVDDPAPSAPKLADLHGFRVLLLWIPAACDLTGTTLMNIGLLYTPVSIYQMTRGALVLFVGVLSVAFLGRRLWLYQWLALVTVMAGVSIVGLSGSMIKNATPTPNAGSSAEPAAALVGVFFILFAQCFTAIQFVVEEEIMARYSIHPLRAVGYEGLFGTLTILLCIPLLAQLADRSTYFDLPRGWRQIVNTPTVLWTSVAIALSIALFNGFGLSVTRRLSATARSVIDTCRTLAIWLVSLALAWEHLLFPISLLQVTGFALLVYGTFLFNNLVAPPKLLRPLATAPAEDERALLRDDALDDTAALPADLGSSGYDVAPPTHNARAVSRSREPTR